MEGSVWLCFLRALAFEIDSRSEAVGRDTLLRAIGKRMSDMLTVPRVDTLEALELEINMMLKVLGWGSVRLEVRESDRCVMITHSGLPRIGSAGEPRGYWLGAALEGLYEGWLVQQSAENASLRARRRIEEGHEHLVLQYARD
jgi:Cellulose synthase subunit D